MACSMASRASDVPRVAAPSKRATATRASIVRAIWLALRPIEASASRCSSRAALPPQRELDLGVDARERRAQLV